MGLVRRLANHPIIRQQGKFLAVGVICTVVDFGIFNVLRSGFDVASIPALTAGFAVSVVTSFVLNRTWTFEVGGKVDWRREAIPFLIVSLVGWGLQAVAVWGTERWLSTAVLIVNAAKVAGVGTIWFLKFFIYRKYVFVDRRPATAIEAAALATEGL